jgi:hypothetical protein
MSLININGSIEIINDQCSPDSITELIRQYMGDDMAEYIEQTMKEKDEQNEDLLEELKSAGEDLRNLMNKDLVHEKNHIENDTRIKKLLDGVSDVYGSIFDLLIEEYDIAI